MSYLQNEQQDLFHLEIDETAKASMLEMSRWTKFLAIMGFIFIGFMIIAGIAMGAVAATGLLNSNPAFANLGAGMFLLIYVILAVVYFYPVFCLLRYSSCIKIALNTANKEQFNKAINYLKNMFKYVGILTIVMIAIYGVAIVLMGIGAASSGF